MKGNANKKRIKQIKCPELEENVLDWMNDAKSNGEKITGSQIKSVALEIASKLGVDDFSGSNGWLCSFFKRHGIVLSEFNGDNDTSIQLIKMRRSADTSNVENVEYFEDVIQESPEKVQFEVKEEEVVEEILTYTAEWRSWCLLCSGTGLTSDYNPNLNEVIQKLFNIEPEENIKICNACQMTVQSISNFMDKAKVSESMFNEFEELESQNRLSDEIVLQIRSEYGIDSNEEDLIYEDIEMEEETLEDNNQSLIEPSETIEEFIYDEELENISETTIVEDQNSQEINCDEPSLSVNAQKIDDTEYDFTCHICNETFSRMFFLTNHTREQHSCLPQVACITCGKYLATWETLLSHRRKHSSEEANFECGYCSTKFVTQTGLSIHVKIKHGKNGDIDNNICRVCNREFKDSQVLKTHMRVHLTDEEKFPCQCHICHKRLASKYSLKHHITTVHEQAKTINCHLCSKTFSNRSNLRSHLISHTTENVICPICNLVFKNRVSLQSHKKLHKINSKNFSCPECGRLFFNRHHLQRHRIAHSNVRNYKCDQCEMAYKWVSFYLS